MTFLAQNINLKRFVDKKKILVHIFGIHNKLLYFNLTSTIIKNISTHSYSNIEQINGKTVYHGV